MSEKDTIKKVEQRRQEIKDHFAQQTAPEQITQKFIRKCLKEDQQGDGRLYGKINEGQFIFNAKEGEWYAWQGHSWKRDVLFDSLNAVENVALTYLEQARINNDEIYKIHADRNGGSEEKIKQLEKINKDLYSRAKRLRRDTGRMQCLRFARDNKYSSLRMDGDDFDTVTFKLACKNGVINLKTGELMSGQQKDYITKSCPTHYQGLEAKAPAWEKFLREIMCEDGTLVSYIQRLLGYAITGSTNLAILPVLWGRGRNGKSTLIETLMHVLGPLAAPIRSEMLLDQGRVTNSAGPSPDILALKGLRCAFASESDENRKFSTSKCKWLSGSDTLVGRYPHEKHDIHFRPTHTLFLSTNEKPKAPADDFAFWERIQLIPFSLSFVERKPIRENERPADPDLRRKLIAEAPAILSWLVRGSLDYVGRGGLDPPLVVVNATAEYRRELDLLEDWLEQRCHRDDHLEANATELYNNFKEWWTENVSKWPWSQSKFGKALAKRHTKSKSGTVRYYGVALKESNPDSGQ